MNVGIQANADFVAYASAWTRKVIRHNGWRIHASETAGLHHLWSFQLRNSAVDLLVVADCSLTWLESQQELSSRSSWIVIEEDPHFGVGWQTSFEDLNIIDDIKKHSVGDVWSFISFLAQGSVADRDTWKVC